MDLDDVFPANFSKTEPQRLDLFLVEIAPEVSRSRWSKLIKAKTILVNHKNTESSYMLKNGDVVSVESDQALKKDTRPGVDYAGVKAFIGPAPQILFEDADIVVVNKPKGLSVHYGAGHSLEETLVAWLITTGRLPKDKEHLLSFDGKSIEEGRPGIVHRLDLPTSGALLVAKNPKIIPNLVEQFADKSAGRSYYAWVSPKFNLHLEHVRRRVQEKHARGVPLALKVTANTAEFVAPIGRDPRNRLKNAVNANGKYAATEFEILENSQNLSLLNIKLKTGRTHQIRVHLSFLSYPIIGDSLYGGDESEFLRLHAHTLSFLHPQTGELIIVEAPLYAEDASWSKSKGFVKV